MPQVLLVDVGNTHTVVGVLDGERIAPRLRLATDRHRTADEYAALLVPLLAQGGVRPAEISGCLVSSVVPPMNVTLKALARNLFDVQVVFVEPGIKTGLPIRYDNPTEVGADRIVNSVAARHIFGSPVVVVDFGTATTFDLVDEGGAYAGGIIAPGVGISAEALFDHASKLSQVDLRRPAQLVGKSTASAMQSGIYYGYLSLVDGILERLKEERPGLDSVVATGGQAALLAGDSRHIRHVDELLTLKGLEIIYRKNPNLFPAAVPVSEAGEPT